MRPFSSRSRAAVSSSVSSRFMTPEMGSLTSSGESALGNALMRAALVPVAWRADMSEGRNANVEWIIANAINEQARGDPDALAPHIIAALEKAGFRITQATEDTALGSQPF